MNPNLRRVVAATLAVTMTATCFTSCTAMEEGLAGRAVRYAGRAAAAITGDCRILPVTESVGYLIEVHAIARYIAEERQRREAIDAYHRYRSSHRVSSGRVYYARVSRPKNANPSTPSNRYVVPVRDGRPGSKVIELDRGATPGREVSVSGEVATVI